MTSFHTYDNTEMLIFSQSHSSIYYAELLGFGLYLLIKSASFPVL